MKSKKEYKRSTSNINNNIKSDIFQTYSVAILAVFTFLLYIQVINFDFSGFDDRVIIQENNELLSSVSNIGEVFLNDAFFQGGKQQFFRPLQNLTFMFDTIIAGGNTWMYHITNLIFHILAVIALYYLLLELGFSSKISLISSLLFASSPLFNHAVVWVPGRGDIMLGIFSMLFLFFLSKYLKTDNIKFLIFNFISFIFALLSKESALFLPLMALLFVIIMHSEKFQVNKAILPGLVYTILVILYFFLRNSVIISEPKTGQFGLEILISNFRVLPEILAKFVVPYSLAPLPNYSTIYLGIGIVLIIGIFYLITRLKEDKIFSLYGLFWFLLFSIPGMLYRHEFGNFAYDYLDHRAYLPIIGLLIILNILYKNFVKADKKIVSVLIGIIAIFSVVTIQNSRNYKNDLVMYEKCISANPETTALAYLNRGLIKARSGNIKSGITDFNKAIEIFPDYPDAYNNRALANSQIGEKTGIMADYNKSIELNPEKSTFYFNRAVFKSAEGDKEGAMIDYLKANEISPKDFKILRNIIYEFTQKQDYENALKYSTMAIENLPKIGEAYQSRGIAKIRLNDTTGACQDWKKAVELGQLKANDLIRKFCK